MTLTVVCWSWLPLACKADCAYLFLSDAGSLKLAILGVFRQWELAKLTHHVFFSREPVYQHIITAADVLLGGLLKLFLSDPLFISHDSVVFNALSCGIHNVLGSSFPGGRLQSKHRSRA